MTDSVAGPRNSEPQRKTHILIAEDDANILESLRDLLTTCGYRVWPAGDGEQAIMLLQEHSEAIGLILSDVTMPNLNGHQLLARILENPRWASIPFVFITADAQAGDEPNGLAAGVCGYVRKPFDAADLLEAVERCCSVA